MAYCKWFNQLSKNSAEEVGTKASTLARLFQEGFPVPPGFVIMPEMFQRFLKERKLEKKIAEILKHKNDLAQRPKILEQVSELLLNSSLPMDMQDEIMEFYRYIDVADDLKGAKSAQALLQSTSRDLCYVSIRASPRNAGQGESYLSIKGQANLLNAIQKCWASAFDLENEDYSKMAVIVQKQIGAEKSGTVMAKENSPMEINAVYGLDAPDLEHNKYFLEKDSGSLVKTENLKQETYITRDDYTGELKRKPLPKENNEMQMTKQELNILFKLSKQVIDMNKNVPLEIAWATEKNKLYLLGVKEVKVQQIAVQEPVAPANKLADVVVSDLGAVGMIKLNSLEQNTAEKLKTLLKEFSERRVVILVAADDDMRGKAIVLKELAAEHQNFSVVLPAESKPVAEELQLDAQRFVLL